MCLWKKECKIGGFQDKIESIVGKPTFIIMKLTSLESLYLAQFQSAIFILTQAYFRCQKWWYLLVVCKNNKLCRAILASLYSDYIIHSTGIDHGQPREGRPVVWHPFDEAGGRKEGGTLTRLFETDMNNISISHGNLILFIRLHSWWNLQSIECKKNKNRLIINKTMKIAF